MKTFKLYSRTLLHAGPNPDRPALLLVLLIGFCQGTTWSEYGSLWTFDFNLLTDEMIKSIPSKPSLPIFQSLELTGDCFAYPLLSYYLLC